MADKPNVFPIFATDDIIDPVTLQPNVTAPSTPFQLEGWKYNTPVNRQNLNYLHRLYDEWIQWLEQECVANTTQIGINVSNIATNTTNIGTNTTNIGTNTSNISTLQIDVNNIGNQVATNVINIGNNTTNIGNNTTNISNNAGDIQDVEDNLNYQNGSKNYDFSNIASGLELLEYTRVGRNVTVWFDNFIGTITAANMFLQAFGAPAEFPSGMLPYTYPIWCPCQVVVSGVERLGALRWVDNTQLQLYFLEPFESGGSYYNRLQPNFPIGATCGMREQCITYRTTS